MTLDDPKTNGASDEPIHQWLVVGSIQDRLSGQIGVVQVCSCGEQARTVPAPWVKSE